MKHGHHIQLTRQQDEQAIRQRAFEIARSRGHIPPHADALDFHERVAIQYNVNDGGMVGVPIVASVELTWEET